MATVPVPSGLDVEEARLVLARHVEDKKLHHAIRGRVSQHPGPVRPGALAQIAVRDEHWRTFAATHELLSASEVATLLGSRAADAKSFAANLRRRHHVLGVVPPGSRAKKYPAFQFLPATSTAPGRVHPLWSVLVTRLAEAGWSEEGILSWAGSPNGWLEDDLAPGAFLAAHPQLEQVPEELDDALRSATGGGRAGSAPTPPA